MLAQEHGKRILTDQLTVDAISLRIMAGIEAINDLDPQMRDVLVGDVWRDMRAMRNRIAHAYDTIDAALVEATIQQDVPLLLARIDTLLEAEQQSPPPGG